MSITFWCPSAPTQRVQPYADEPEYFENQSTLPEVNLSNTNAGAMLEMLGRYDAQDPGMCGDVAAADLDDFIRDIDAALAVPVARAAFLEPSHIVVGGSGLRGELHGAPNALSAFMLPELETEGTTPPGVSSLGALLARKLNARPGYLGTTSTGEVLEVSGRGCSVFSMGRSDDYLVRRLTQLKELALQAKAHNWGITWG